MTDAERARCRTNGVRRLVRAKLGYEAYAVLAHRDSAVTDLSRTELYGAIGQLVADGNKLVPNTRARWNAVAEDLPDTPIKVYVPSASAPTWDAFVNLVLRPGCEAIPAMQQLEATERLRTCARVRSDDRLGHYRASDPELPDRLRDERNALAAINLADRERFAPAMRPLAVDGAKPTIAAISAGRYAAAQPIYAYIKAQHYAHVPGFLYYVDELTSKRALGHQGYLREAGLTPLTQRAWRAQRATAIGMNPISLVE